MMGITKKSDIIYFTTIIILIILPLIIRNTFFNYLFTLIFLWAFIGEAWNILWYAGQLSFGHAAFFGIGAYAVALSLTNYGISPLIGIWIGGIVSILLGILIGYPTFRLKGVYFALATIAIAELVRLLTLMWKPITKGAIGVIIPWTASPVNLQFRNNIFYYYITFLMLIIGLYIAYKIENSKLGIAFRTIKDDDVAAQTVGVYAFKYKMIALMISAFLTALGGGIFALLMGYIRPDVVMTLDRSEEIILMVLIGGAGSYIGPVIGSLIYIPIREVIITLTGGHLGMDLIIYGLLIIVIIVFSPGGVYSYIKRFRGAEK